jgi:ubiquinone/menaquinone biosynthesis C-methylase UbiE
MSLSFDRVAHEYDETRGGEPRGEEFARDLTKLLDVDTPLLEVGVGTGLVARGLTLLGHHVVGVDISEAMLRRALDRIGPRVAQADAMTLPLRSASVTQAISVWVLHVVADQLTVMRDVHRVLRPGGRYLVMDGAVVFEDGDLIHEAWEEITEGLGWPAFVNRTQERADLAPQAGFRVVDVVRTGPYEIKASYEEFVSTLERRTNSRMWSVSDEDFARVVQPVIDRMRELPDFTEPITRIDYQDVLVLER